MITEADMFNAIDRIARTTDGLLLYRWLQNKRLEVFYHGPDSALRSHEGERILASTLMFRMQEGIDASGGRIDSAGDGKPSERPVILAGRKSVKRDRINYRDWAAEHDPELQSYRDRNPDPSKT